MRGCFFNLLEQSVEVSPREISSGQDYALNLPRVTDLLQRVSIQQNQIGALSDLDRSGVGKPQVFAGV